MGTCLIIKSGGGTDTSNATATADKVLSGYTIYSNDNKMTGTMTNVGTQTASGLNAGGNATIKAGWHDGNGTITANTLSSQTQCDIPDASWCLSGYSCWKNGSKYDGLMVNRGTKKWSLSANGSQTIEGGWHNGSGTVSQSISVDTGEWGPTPTTTNQQLCWQGWYYSKNRWCWGNGNLVAGNIKSGVSIFGVWGNYVETKRYLIQNGSLTGLLSSDLVGYKTNSTWVTNYMTKSYNGSNWLLISGESSWSDDDGWGYSFLVMRRFKSVSNLASFSRTSWNCRFHANILTSYRGANVWSWVTPHCNIFPYWINWYNSKIWHTCPTKVLDNSGNLTFSVGSVACGTCTCVGSKLDSIGLANTGVVSSLGKWIVDQVNGDDLLISDTQTSTTYGLTDSPDSSYWVWCRDLWLETTETTP